MEFRNESGLEFVDISSEEYRIYQFPHSDDGRVSFVRIWKPVKLHVSDSGGHRVFDENGGSHYIPPKWIHLEWKAKEGQPHFVK